MVYSYIFLRVLQAINRNMGCIEIKPVMTEGEVAAKINRNMGCIEIWFNAAALIRMI